MTEDVEDYGRVRFAVEEALEDADATAIERELARAMADKIDSGDFPAALVKELDRMMVAIAGRKGVESPVLELLKKRDGRRTG